MQHAIKRFDRARYPVFADDLFILGNTWDPGDPLGNKFTEESFVLKQIPALANIGVDVLQIDDGWEQGGSLQDANGFLPIYKNGWKDIKTEADRNNLKLGLWVALRNARTGWTALCLGNKDFVDLMANHIQEFVSKYELDGAWLDMADPIAPECYCDECVYQIRAAGKDPFDKDVHREHQNKNFIEFHHRMKVLVHATCPGCHVDFNDFGLGKVSERAEFLDNIDIEALPTDPQWGYFMRHCRYATSVTLGFLYME